MHDKFASYFFACALATAAFGAGTAQAATIFDTKALAEAGGAPTYDGQDALFSGLGAVINPGANTLVNQIGMFVRVPVAQNVKFLIFNNGYGSGSGAVLLYSQTKFFNATAGMQYIYSDPFSFTLLKDVPYDIGVIGEAPGAGELYFRYTVYGTWIQNSLTETMGSHIATYGAPVSGSYSLFQPFVQLNTVPVAAPVPEPAGWALMIGGLAAVGAALRTRRVRARTAGPA